MDVQHVLLPIYSFYIYKKELSEFYSLTLEAKMEISESSVGFSSLRFLSPWRTDTQLYFK